VVALIMQRLDMTLAPGYDVTKWESGLTDYFIIVKGALPVVVKDRV